MVQDQPSQWEVTSKLRNDVMIRLVFRFVFQLEELLDEKKNPYLESKFFFLEYFALPSSSLPKLIGKHLFKNGDSGLKTKFDVTHIKFKNMLRRRREYRRTDQI